MTREKKIVTNKETIFGMVYLGLITAIILIIPVWLLFSPFAKIPMWGVLITIGSILLIAVYLIVLALFINALIIYKKTPNGYKTKIILNKLC